MARVIYVVLIVVSFTFLGCAKKADIDKLNDRLDAQETQIAKMEEGDMLLGADYGMFKLNLQQFNKWVFESLNAMIPYVHTHENMEEPTEN